MRYPTIIAAIIAFKCYDAIPAILLHVSEFQSESEAFLGFCILLCFWIGLSAAVLKIAEAIEERSK